MEDSDDKTHQPTEKKLQDAREKGEIARSQEIGIALTYLSLAVTLCIFGASTFEKLTYLLRYFLVPSTLIAQANTTLLSPEIFISIGASILPIFLIPFGLVAIMIVLQRSAIFVGSNIAPKLNRISPAAGFKKKFGLNGIFEFLKSFTKLLLYVIALLALLIPLIDQITGISLLQPQIGTKYIFEKCLSLLYIATLISISLAIVDYLWQHAQFIKKNMMSFQQIKDEHREAEGDPHFKNARRQRAMEIASNRMMHDVPNADVVIVNPTHYAVALAWDPRKSNAPIVLAKGVDEIALKIRQIANEKGIPVHVDIPTARQLASTASIGDEIPVAFYGAVAAAIRFAQSAQKH